MGSSLTGIFQKIMSVGGENCSWTGKSYRVVTAIPGLTPNLQYEPSKP